MLKCPDSNNRSENMKIPVKWLALPLGLSIMPAAGAGAPSVHKADDDAITAIAIQAAAQSLKLDAEQLKLAPENIRYDGDWAFMQARLRDAADKRFDYAGTALHKAAQAGAMSDLCVALLRRDGQAWKLIDIAVGPSDVAWEDWAGRHHAPEVLFK